MPFSERTVLDPEESKPGIPLKRGTVIGLLVVLLVLALIAALLLNGTGSGPSAPPAPVAKDSGELKQVGSASELEAEKQRALQAAKVARAASSAASAGASASVATGSAGAATAPLPPGDPRTGIKPPAGVARTDNSGALYAGGVRRPSGAGSADTAASSEGDDSGLQVDAQARISKVMVMDESPVPDQQRDRTAGPAAAERTALTDFPPPGAVQPPSAALGAQYDALRAQAAALQQRQRPGAWLREFAQESTGAERETIRVQAPTPGFVLRKGKVIPAVTERQLNSDLPGTITARVRENVYDAKGNLLIPFGSALVGKYDADIKIGQERVLFAFSDLILPNGVTFKLPAAGGADLAGAAGITGDVNNHFFKIFGSALLIAILADHTSQPASVTSYGGGGPVTAVGQVLSDTTKTMLQRNQNLAPTITVDQGTRINVEVVADMVFPAPYGQKVSQ